jgi:competence protein ComEA
LVAGHRRPTSEESEVKKIPVLLMAFVTSLGLGMASVNAMAQDKAAAKPGKAADVKAPVDAKATRAAEPLDLNTASMKELEALPGVGPVRAAAIVKGRPYRGKNELVDKKIVPDNVYNDIKDKIVAKQAAK